MFVVFFSYYIFVSYSLSDYSLICALFFISEDIWYSPPLIFLTCLAFPINLFNIHRIISECICEILRMIDATQVIFIMLVLLMQKLALYWSLHWNLYRYTSLLFFFFFTFTFRDQCFYHFKTCNRWMSRSFWGKNKNKIPVGSAEHFPSWG